MWKENINDIKIDTEFYRAVVFAFWEYEYMYETLSINEK